VSTLWKKRYLLIVLIVFIGIAIWSYLNSETQKMYTQIDKGDFQMEYILEYGFKGYNTNTQIFFDGSYTKKTSYLNNETYNIEKGYYQKNDVAKFIKYAIQHNLFEMNDNMNNDNIIDGRNIFFIIPVSVVFFFTSIIFYVAYVSTRHINHL